MLELGKVVLDLRASFVWKSDTLSWCKSSAAFPIAGCTIKEPQILYYTSPIHSCLE